MSRATSRAKGRRRRGVVTRGDRTVIAWGLLFLTIGVVLSACAAWPIYQSWRVFLVVGAGSVLGGGTALLARRLSWTGVSGAITTVATVIIGYLIVVVPVAIPSALVSLAALPRGIRDGFVGVVVGWKQLLTLDLPVGEYQAVLVPLLVVVTAGTLIGALLVLRDDRWSPLAAVPVSLMVVFGVAFGSSATSDPVAILGWTLPAPREVLIGVGTLLAALIWLVGRSRLSRSRALARAGAGAVSRSDASVWGKIRRHALAASLVAIAIVGGVALAPAAASLGDRGALRDEVDPLVVVQQQPSPLSGYRGWFAVDKFDAELFRVTGDVDRVARLPLAVLDYYDGESVHVASDRRFSRLPRAALPGSDRINLGVSVGSGYSGVWVLAPGELVAAPEFAGPRAEALADGFHIAADGGGSVDVAPARAGWGLRPGDSYRLSAESPRADSPSAATDFDAAQGGESKIDAEEYPALVEWAKLQEPPRTGAGLSELIDRLRARGYLSHGLLSDADATAWTAALAGDSGYTFLSSYAGHSRSRIENLFSTLVDQERRAGVGASDATLVSAVGDDEQFAVAAAMLARYLGFDSRVAVGFRLGAADVVPGVAACVDVCTGGQLTAWVEVKGTSGTWIPFDVTPQFATLPLAISEGEQLPENPTVPSDSQSKAVEPPQAPSDSSDADVVPDRQEDDAVMGVWLVVRGIIVGAGALMLLLLPFAVIVITKRMRRHMRRTAGDTEVRIVGAWEELIDTYVDAGVPFTHSPSRVLVADSVDRVSARELATVVERAVFSEHPPSASAADEAWAVVDGERRILGREHPFTRRLISAVTLRSFVDRLGRQKARAAVFPASFRKEVAS